MNNPTYKVMQRMETRTLESTHLICERMTSTSAKLSRNSDSCVLVLIIFIIRGIGRVIRGVEWPGGCDNAALNEALHH